MAAKTGMKNFTECHTIGSIKLHQSHSSIDRYCQETGIQPFIDLNPGNTGNFVYKDTFSIGADGVPVCKLGLRMKPDGVEANRNRCKWSKSQKC